jgi:hypothetical protein
MTTYVSTSSPLVSGTNGFPQPVAVPPNGTLLNLDSETTVLNYQFTSGGFYLNNLTLVISTSSRTASADYITLDIPGPGEAFDAAQLGSGMLNSVVIAGVNAAIDTYLTSTPAVSGMPISISYNGNAKVGTWTLTIQGNAADTLPITYGTPTVIFPAGNVDISVQCNAVDLAGNIYFWGDITGVYDIIRTFNYIEGDMVSLPGTNASVPMMLIDGTNSTAPVYLRLDQMGYQWTALALKQIANNPAATPYLSLFPVIPFNPLIREQKVASQGYSFIFKQYVYVNGTGGGIL